MWSGRTRSVFASFASFAWFARFGGLLVVVGAGGQTRQPQPPPTTIQPVAGFAVERAIARGTAHRYELPLAAGQFADVVIANPAGFDATTPNALTVTLADRTGTELCRLTRETTSHGTKRLFYASDRTEVYTVTLESTATAAAVPVRYTLRVSDVRPASDADRMRAKALIELLEADTSFAKRSAEGYRDAASRYRASADLWEKTGERSEHAHVLHRLALLHSLTNSFSSALEADRQAAAMAHELGERRAEATALAGIGTTYVRLTDYALALQYFERALPLFRATNDRDAEAYTLASVAALWQSMGDPQKALEYYPAAIALWKTIGNREGEALGLHGAGTAHRLLGNLPAALELLEHALQLRRALGHHAATAAALTQIGHSHLALGHIDQAFASYEEAFRSQRAAGAWRGDGFAEGVGRAVVEHDDWPATMTYFSLGSGIFRASGTFEARLLHDAGRVEPKPGDVRRGVDLLTRAHPVMRAFGNRRWAAVLDTAFAAWYGALGETDRALQGFADALPVFRGMHDRAGEAMALVGLAYLEKRIDRLADALGHAEAAIGSAESMRTYLGSQELRALYASTLRNAYWLYIDLEMALDAREPGHGRQEAALAASERARARGLIDLLVEAKLDITQGIDPQLLQRERQLETQIRAADDRLTRLLSDSAKPDGIVPAEHEAGALVGELRDVRRQLRAQSPQYAALTQPVPLDLQAIQRLLDPDTVLLEYALGPDRSYVWAISRTTMTTAVLKDRRHIEDAARRSYGLLSTGARRVTELQTRRALEALADLVLAPIAPALSARRVVIVADGALQYVPFAALPLPGGTRATAGDPVIARHEVVMLPSASTLDALRQVARPPRRSDGTVAVFADPVLRADDRRVRTVPAARPATRPAPSAVRPPVASDALSRSAGDVGLASLDRLPFTRAEANAIAALAGSSHTLKALDFDASRDAAIAAPAPYRIVHFATHALMNDRHPELSGIILSLVDRDGRPTDGFLRLHDIYNLSLNADLVVLSACRTALGKDIRGEGLVGLTRGFLYAGAPAVVASLWDVRDRSTAALMTRFYRAMLRDHLSPAAALRAAQTSMRRDPRWAAPAHWAGFVLQGDWRETP